MTEAFVPRGADVQHPTLLGHQTVAALWWPANWRDEAGRRRAILAAWEPGAALYRFASGDLLCLAHPRAMDCDRLSAWPLRRVAGTLCSAALRPADLAGRPMADAWLAEGSRLRPLLCAEAEAVDPAAWLEVDVSFLVPFDLSQPEQSRELVAQPKDLHDILGPNIPRALAPDARRLVESLRKAAEPGLTEGAGRGAVFKPAYGGLWTVGRWVLALVAIGFVVSLLSKLVFGHAGVSRHWLWLGVLGLFAGLRLASDATPRASESTTSAATGLRERIARSRVVPQRWREWVTRLAVSSRLARLLGAQHAAYMRRMLAMFDEGRLDDALRHAIPLGVDGESLGQAFGRLGPRQDLRLGDRGRATTSVNLGVELETHLRALYRRAAQQLEAAGRIDEAVFVVAELLQSRQEALDLLERRQRVGDAAELAFRWDMAAAQIVRLYALAGNWQRAVLVARRDNAFAPAVDLLQSRWPRAAEQLRVEWAEALVANGRWLNAIEVIWPLTREHARAAPWLDVAQACGGAVAVRALAWRAQLWPESLPTRLELIQSLRTDPGLAVERLALAEELLRLPAPPSTGARRLATLFAGPLMADMAGPKPLAFDAQRLRQLIGLAGDAALSADLPALEVRSLGSPARPLETQQEAIEAEVPPVGLQAIHDAIPLADGELLLALGEGGVVRVDSRGRRLSHFPVPAQRLVAADEGGIALALIQREEVWRVSRLELASGRWVDLGQHRLAAFAERFDGVGWSVGVGNRVEVLDVQSPGLRDVLWRVADLPGPVSQIQRGDTKEHWLLDARTEQTLQQQWTYLLPARRLLSREEAPPTDGNTLGRGMVTGHGLVDLRIVSGPEVETRVRPHEIAPTGQSGGTIALAGAEVKSGGDNWFALSRVEGQHELLELVHWHSAVVHARWRWPKEDQPRQRFHSGRWLVFDARGRVAVLDTRTSSRLSLTLS